MRLNRLRIATRNSLLARWQAEHVATQLRERHPGLRVELVGMTTRGDRILDTPLAKVGGKGLFVKELEQGLLDGRADLAVHSMKDVPVDLPPGLCLPVLLARADPRDAFVSHRYAHLDQLPPGSRVGTSSLRRQCQLLARHPDLRISDLRGNVDSRLAKLDDGQYDAIILAAAGLHRLGRSERITAYLAPELSLPAIGQGAIGLECRADDGEVLALIQPLDDATTHTCVRAERALNAHLQGGCQVPIAGYAVLETEQSLWLRGLVADPTGRQVLRAEQRGPSVAAESLGHTLADALLQQGAAALLAAAYAGDQSPVPAV